MEPSNPGQCNLSARLIESIEISRTEEIRAHAAE